MKITILLFEEVDLLDAGGPYEVFLTAARLIERNGGEPLFDINTATVDNKPVTAYGGLGLIPNSNIEDAMQADILIVPGTIDIDKAVANASLIDNISAFAERTQDENIIASVCTGSFLLAKAGLLRNQNWTTHWEDIDALASLLGSEGTKRSVRWVDNGAVVTAAGLSSGIDMALHLVDRYCGVELAEKTARQIDYNWDRTGIAHA